MYNFRSNCSPLDCYISYNLYLKKQVRENRYFDIFYVVKHNLIERSLNLVSIQVLKNLPAVHRSFAMIRTSANSLSWLNSFAPNAPFLYPLKTSKNLTVFWCFQGVEKGCIRNKWVKTFLWFGNFTKQFIIIINIRKRHFLCSLYYGLQTECSNILGSASIHNVLAFLLLPLNK